MREGRITRKDGRSVAYADYGAPADIAVVWCHGGPGCRFEPEISVAAAARAGIRLIGIDRPGYGRSTRVIGRTIGDWVPDALAVLDHLGIDRFISVGVSTGGAYALALASQSRRAMGAVACCAVSDMRWEEGRATIPGTLAVWQAASREEAEAIVVEQFGARGEKVNVHTTGEGITERDRALFARPEQLAVWLRSLPEMFAQGVGGYTDDRLADGRGWDTFDVSSIRCPVVVLHGTADTMAPVVHAHHTASLVPGAVLRLVEGHGHFSILMEIPDAISEVLALAGMVTSPAAAP
jgi:pimeloyl-ACP methyl ester carboxylesterase